jgi:amino acid adenylation domain-containing protein
VFDEPVVIKPPSSSMRDAVALELEALENQDNYDFWAHYLDGATLMRLPRLSSGPSADRGAREIVRIAVPIRAELSDRLKQLAGANAVPLKSVLLAAHMMVMCQYNGQLDTLTYTVTNGRPEAADGSTAIGLFVNSLAIRLALTGGTWNDLITQTFETEQQSLRYRRLPMAELKRHQGNEPLAETLFFFTDYHVFRELQRWRQRGVEHVTSELYGESTFPFCAIFRLNRDDSRLEVRIEYDSLQFPASLMDAIADCYVRVLETMAAEPQSPYHTQSLLSGAEWRRSVVDWNGTQPDPSDARLIHRLIERRASETPDAVAIVSGESAVSYRELDRRASRIAAALKAHGAGPERVVALMTGRSVEAVAAMLGTLKTGAAYLPLDPAFPPERIAAIVRDARPAVALSEPEHVCRLPSLPVLTLHPGREPVTAQAGPPPRASTAPGRALTDNAAYVIYTSGSTGEPKGVVVTHRGLLNSTLARDRHYAQPPGRFLLLSPLVFDSSAAGLFWTLCTGGTLVLPPYGVQLEPATLARLAAEQHVTHTLAVPSLLSALLDQRRPELLRSLRTVISAGEPCPKDLWTELRAVLPDAVLHNEYGPTENTVWSTVWAAEPVAYRTQLPIGRPVAGVQAYVLNPHLQPVPCGVAGELCLGGSGLARGYLGRPGLTAARFLPDPFRSGARMYASGDLARHAANGDLEFLGRADKQVKIRGFRVEPGEIEGTLDMHPAVRRSVVVSRQDDADGTSLAAYVVLVPGTAADGAELQQFLRDRLPRYMIPARCTVLDELPLTPTGKVDVASLPAPVRSGHGGRPISPRTEAELLLSAVWCQVLGLDQVGVRDEFFEIGGESLRAMQVVTKVNKVLDLDLPVRSLFDAPTIEEFARVVELEQACPGTGSVGAQS